MSTPATARTNFQLKFLFGAKIPFDIKETTLDWRQGVRSKSLPLADVVGFGIKRMPKVLGTSASELIIAVATGGNKMSRFRVPVDPDDAETIALLEALAARLPGKDVRTMQPSYAAQIVPAPSPWSDWLNGRTAIGVCLMAASAMTGAMGRAKMSGGGSFEAGQRVGYGVAVLAGILGGGWLIFSGVRRARKARLAKSNENKS